MKFSLNWQYGLNKTIELNTPLGQHHTIMHENDKIDMDENLHMEWYGQYGQK
jgi:hypothetical protein